MIRFILVMRREFSSTYDQTIILIKQLKNSNDYLNRAIGVQSPNTVIIRLKQENPMIESNIHKIDSLIEKLQQSYLDPDTARKIGTAKQQFRIQKDRRKQLLISADVNDHDQSLVSNKRSQITTVSSLSGEHERKNSDEGSTWSRFTHHGTELQTKNNMGRSIELQKQEEIDHNFEFQQKMMRERSQELDHLSRNLLNVHNIINQTSNLTFEQGEKLDIIGEEIFEAYRGVREAREQLSQANEHQKKAKRKYVVFSLMLLLVVAVVIGIMIA